MQAGKHPCMKKPGSLRCRVRTTQGRDRVAVITRPGFYQKRVRAYFAALLTFLTTVSALFLACSLAASNWPLAIWPMASLVFSVRP